MATLTRHPNHSAILRHIREAKRGLPDEHPGQGHLDDAARRLRAGDHEGARRALRRAKAVVPVREDAIDGDTPALHAAGRDLAGSARRAVDGASRRAGERALRRRVEHVGSYADTLDRARGMRMGETIRLPDGNAIKHHATEDGRPVWSALRPSVWQSALTQTDPARATPEEAVRDALRNSLRSNDPASLGGARRIDTGAAFRHDGKPVRVVDADPDGRVLVRDAASHPGRGALRAVKPSELTFDAAPLAESALDGLLNEASRRTLIDRLASAGPPRDTLDAHREGATLSPERTRLHAALVKHVLDNPDDHDRGPVALVAHRRGEKVHTIKRWGGGPPVPAGAVHISIPALREALPEHPKLKARPDADERALTDREARHLAKTAATLALHRGRPVAVHDEVVR